VAYARGDVVIPNSTLYLQSMTAEPASPTALTLRGNPIPRELDEDIIHAVVHGFYGHIRNDALLGPVFGARIANERWPEHLAKMCDFWSATLLRTERYAGRPLRPHLAIEELDDAHFDRWLTLFRQTVLSECTPAAAEIFLDFAHRIARSFRMAVAFHRGEDSTALAPLPIEAALKDDSARPEDQAVAVG
jgi:hemoglobin